MTSDGERSYIDTSGFRNRKESLCPGGLGPPLLWRNSASSRTGPPAPGAASPAPSHGRVSLGSELLRGGSTPTRCCAHPLVQRLEAVPLPEDRSLPGTERSAVPACRAAHSPRGHPVSSPACNPHAVRATLQRPAPLGRGGAVPAGGKTSDSRGPPSLQQTRLASRTAIPDRFSCLWRWPRPWRTRRPVFSSGGRCGR